MFIVDCDCHNYWTKPDVLLPYMDGLFKDFFERGECSVHNGKFPYANRPWLHPEGFSRHDINPITEEDNYTIMLEKHLNRYNIGAAVLTGDEPIEVSGLANPYYAAALCKAYNDYMIDWWLPKDDRFWGSMVVAPQHPELAAQEIRRVGSHPKIVQVLVSHGAARPYGEPFYHPIYEACNEMGLPFAMHLGGQGGINVNQTGGGHPTFFWEAHAVFFQPAMTHLASMIANGVFEKWPNLKTVIIECGVAWVAPVLWRLDANYKALRKETPWLKMLPSEYFKRNVRFSTQPLEQPENNEHLWSILDAMDGKNTLLYASDYPHWDYDAADLLHIPDDWRANIMGGNALKVYDRIVVPSEATQENSGKPSAGE